VAKPEKPLELPCWNCAKVSPVACPNCGQIYHQSALPKVMAAMLRGLKALVNTDMIVFFLCVIVGAGIVVLSLIARNLSRG
jgi:hypothetical protein